MNRPIFLIGMPGAGKTTLGRALAKALDRRFIDLDHYIEARYFRSVAQLFEQKGEQEFRLIESRMLREVADMQDVVVATGGGTPCFHSGMDLMLEKGVTVHLVPSEERLHERLCRYRARRPALATLSDEEIAEYIKRIKAERNPIYSRAKITLESSSLEDRTQIAETVTTLLPLLNKESTQPINH